MNRKDMAKQAKAERKAARGLQAALTKVTAPRKDDAKAAGNPEKK